MAAKVKFPLKMANGAQVRTLEDLRKNFDLISVLAYYDNKRLYDWLTVYYCDEEVEKIKALDSSADDFKKSLCDILGVQYAEDKSVGVDLSDISKRNERLAKLRTLTSDEAILAAVDNVVFTQEELDRLQGKDIDVIYLCGEQFKVPGSKHNVTYIGVNNPKVDTPTGFSQKGISFEKVDLGIDHIILHAKEITDPVEVANVWRIAAEQGSVEAQFNLGKCYEEGKGVEKNLEVAFKWFRKAAEQGCAEAQCRLGESYYDDGGDAGCDYEDAVYKESFKWYRKAAEQGYAPAEYKLGDCYKYGIGIEQSDAEAFKWYLKAVDKWRIAADQESAEAQFKLGNCYDEGKGVDQNSEEAFKWYFKAAEQGYAKAECELGSIYRESSFSNTDYGIERNDEEAFKWYRKAAEHEYDHAEFVVGNCYRLGNGIEQSYEEAFKWYRKAAEQGHTYAQFRLGKCYEDGDGADGNSEEAFKWYRKAAEGGSSDAQFIIGTYYSSGFNVEQSDEEAIKWYLKAGEHNHPEACIRLGKCYEEGIGVDINLKEAFEFYGKICYRAEGAFHMGRCYEEGIGVEVDDSHAVVWYKQAVEKGFDPAKSKLKLKKFKKYR